MTENAETRVLSTDLDPRTLEEFAKINKAAESALAEANALAKLDPDLETDEGARLAADALKSLRYVRTDAEKFRKDVGRLFADAKSRVDAVFKEIVARPLAAEEHYKSALAKRERAIREREAAEQRKREEEAAAAQALEDAKASKEGRASHHIPAPPPPPAPRGARGFSGAKATPSTELKYRILDVAALPDEYVERVPIRSKILADVRQGVAIAGVEPYTDDRVNVR
jgi:hypothetical protein